MAGCIGLIGIVTETRAIGHTVKSSPPRCTAWENWYPVADMGKRIAIRADVGRRGPQLFKWLAWCLLAALLLAHEDLNKTSFAQGRAGVSPAAQMDLARLVDLCSQRLGLRIDYDPTVVKGQIMLRLPDTLTDNELWALTNQLLAQRGFATVRATNSESISVVRASEASQVARIEPGRGFDLEPVVGKAGFTSLVMAPEYRSAKDMAEALKPLLTKGVGSAVSLGGTRLLLVSDYTGRLAEIQSLIDRLDAPTEEMVVDEVMVANISPQTLVATVMQIVQKRDQVAGERLAGELIASPNGSAVIVVAPSSHASHWKELIGRFDKPEGIDTRNYVPRVFAVQDVARLIDDSINGGAARDPKAASDGGWRVVVDDLTGTLVVTATPSQHAQVIAIMERLDAADGLVHPMRSYPIRNRPASEMQATLSRLIEAGALDANERIAARESVRSGGEQRFLRDVQSTQGTSGILPADPSAPSAPSGSPHGANGVLRKGELGDQLRLTVDESTNTLIAIGEPRLLSQLDTLIQMLDVRQPQVMLEAIFVSITDSDALNLGIELERLGSVNGAAYKVASLFGLSTAASGARTVADSAGFTGLLLDPGEFSVVVKALQAINKGRSLSNPKVLVANNEQARFSSVLQQPFVRTDTTSSTATSSFGGSDSAGTTISVRPQIAQGDHLVLTYSINLSSFVGTPAAAGLPPPKQQNSVDSVATIPDGYAVVVGGLELESESTSTSQIPLLGDIPGLGELFKSRSIGRTRNRFFVFIRASVLRSGSFEDLKYISAKDALESGTPEDWPRLEPRVIP